MPQSEKQKPLIGIKETPRADFDARLSLFRQEMELLGLGVAIVTTPQAVFHLSGLWTGSLGASPILLVTRDRHLVLTRRLDMGWLDILRDSTWATEWQPVDDHEHPATVIAENTRQLLRHAGEPIGAESNTAIYTQPFLKTLHAGLGSGLTVDVEPVLLSMRGRKSPGEIGLMRRAAPLTTMAFNVAQGALAEGHTDAEASAMAYAALLETRPEPLAYHPIVVSGSYNRAVHAPFGGVRPADGEPTTMMLSGIYGGYAAPLERTFFSGFIPERAKNKLTSVVEAIGQVVDRIEPGMTGSQIDSIARGTHERAGYGHNFLHRTGYSIGFGWADLALMQLHRGEERTVEPGMTFHLVPHLYDAEHGLLSVSQPIVITDVGCETINDYPLVVSPIA